MLRAAITFFVIGLIAMFLGMNNVAGLSMEMGRILLFVFLVLSVVTVVGGIALGRGISRKL